jgi:hypothetical protein
LKQTDVSEVRNASVGRGDKYTAREKSFRDIRTGWTNGEGAWKERERERQERRAGADPSLAKGRIGILEVEEDR